MATPIPIALRFKVELCSCMFPGIVGSNSCFHPLICALEDSLPSIKIGRNTQHGPVFAYADDVTVFVTNPGNFHAIQQAIHLYERVKGTRLNPRKSKALAIWGLDRAPDSPGHIL